MDFNLDDPLGDILSDGSNDSFFDNEPKKKSTVAKSTPKKDLTSPFAPAATSTASKGKMEDLFGIKEPSTSPKKFTTPPVTKPSTPAQPITPIVQRDAPKENPPARPLKSVFNDDDLISDLGFDPKKPKSTKSSILDDILGPMEPKKRPLTTGGISKEEKGISRQSTETTESTVPGTYTASLPRPKTAGRHQSITSTNDPLGFLGGKDPLEIKEAKETPKPKRKGTTADWLGLGSDMGKSEKEPTDSTPKASEKPSQNQQVQILTISDPSPALTLPNPGLNLAYPSSPFNQATVLMATSTLEAQNALQTAQQQEAQIMLASQMKNQERALLEMQQKQRELLLNQEAQFNDLIQKQISRQHQLEGAIRAQQERISSHIQMLMSQPVPNFTPGLEAASASEGKQRKQAQVEEQIEDIQLKAEVKKLELENLRLEDLVSNMTANHEKEIDFLETSHKKQIQVLEENQKNIEDRLRGNAKNLEESYLTKVKHLEDERVELMRNYDLKLKVMQDENVAILKRIKADHEAELLALKTEHKNMIENIRQSKLLEFAVVQENSSYLQTLRDASSNLENVTGDIQTLKDNLYTQIDSVHKDRDRTLELREKKIEDSERRLKITEEHSEQERIRLLELVKTLEGQLGKYSRESSDEQWALRQKLSSLEVERASFERERQFARQQISREEKHIESLKQFQLDEYQRHMQQIQDERQLLNEEKAKHEMAKKLHASQTVHTAKSEMETALKVAQDATRQADQERERYFTLQRQMEAKKRELIDQENVLHQKQDELEATICSAKAKEKHAMESVQRARLSERNMNGKIQFLQQQMRQIGEREARLSQESLMLSRERLELQQFKKKLDQNKCSLCRIGERSAEISQLLTHHEGGRYLSGPADPDEVRLMSAQPTVGSLQADDVALMDSDISESLRKMEALSYVDLGVDLDEINLGMIERFANQLESQNVPITYNSETVQVNLDLENM